MEQLLLQEAQYPRFARAPHAGEDLYESCATMALEPVDVIRPFDHGSSFVDLGAFVAKNVLFLE